VTEAARRFDCSRATVCKLIARYWKGGPRALMNRRRGPREPIPEEVVALVVELKTCAPHRATCKVRQLLEQR
jgi:transposase